MQFEVVPVAVTTTGANGSAAGATTVTVRGYVEWIYLDWGASTPNTTDLTVTVAAAIGGWTLFSTTNTVTDALAFPRGSAVTTANAAITDSHVRIPVWGDVTFTLAQSNALAPALTAYIGVSRTA